MLTYFAFYGMCEALQRKADTFFHLAIDSLENKKELVFLGYKNSKMFLNKKTNRWNIISLDDESVIMESDIEVNYCNYVIIVQE